VRVDLKGTKNVKGSGRLIVLASPDLKMENSLEHPTRLAPVERQLPATSTGFQLTLDPYSMTVLRAGYVE
jgi:alpha-L-arabinofuranosidase